MNIEEGLPEELFFSNECDEIITQPVQYEWVPIWCSKCSQYGHTVADCRQRKQKLSNPQLLVDDEGFRPIKKGFRKAANLTLGGRVKDTTSQLLPPQVLGVSEQPTHFFGDGGVQQRGPISEPEASLVADHEQASMAPEQHVIDSVQQPLHSVVVTTNGFSVLEESSDVEDLMNPLSIALGAHPISSNE